MGAMDLLLRLNKGRGILVIVFCFVSCMLSAMVAGILERNVGGIFAGATWNNILGFAFIMAAIWTWLTKNDYYKDEAGNKVKVAIVNSFIFLSMEVWAILFLCAGVLFLTYPLWWALFR